MACRRKTALALLLGCLGGCASEESGISPDRDRFYFPTGVALDPVRPMLYVTSSNADLKYNGGTILALDLRRLPADLSRVAQAVAEKKIDCRVGRTDRTTWECPETQLINPGSTIRIGHFPGGLRVTSDGARLFTPVRGDDHLTWASIVPISGGGVDLQCSSQVEEGCGAVPRGQPCEVWDCDQEHEVDYSNELGISLPTEPFGICLDETVAIHVDASGKRRSSVDGLTPSVGATCGATPRCQSSTDRSCCLDGVDHIYVNHLYGGEISFFTSDASGVVLRDSRGGFFSAQSGIRGGFALAPRVAGDPEGSIYASSRVDSVLASFVIRDHLRIVDESRFAVGALYPGADNRDLAFGPRGERLYVINRQPPSLVAVDMSLENGLPKREVLWVEEVCADPSVLRLAPDPARPGSSAAQLAYVVCYAANQIYVVDTTLGRVVSQIATGKGPNGLEIDPANRRAFVANFLERTIGVIDLDPAHTSYLRMVLRIGLLEDLVKY